MTIYNGGVGYKTGYRVRSGGAEAEAANATATGYIPAKAGDVVSVGGLIRTFVDGGTANAINVYSSLGSDPLGQIVGNSSTGYGIFLSDQSHAAYGAKTVVQKDNCWQWVIPPNAGINYIRVTGFTGGKDDALIVTINELIE